MKSLLYLYTYMYFFMRNFKMRHRSIYQIFVVRYWTIENL